MDNQDETCSFIEALYAKYCDDRPVEEIELVQKEPGHRRVTEYIGFDKLMQSLKNVTNLQHINLANARISSCGTFDQTKFAHLKAISLDLALNRLSNWRTITNVHENFKSLTYISLSKNPISDWNEICKLGSLSSLDTLELSHCKINFISFSDASDLESKTNLFPALSWLDLQNNQINDWKSVAELNRLKSLRTLILKRNPIYDMNQYYYNFNHVISRIGNVTTLDREPVTEALRKDGEKYYLKTIYPEYLKKSDSKERKSFLEENPRIPQLIDKLGEPVVAVVQTKRDKIKQNFITLKIADTENPDENKRQIQKQVPVSTKVSNLKFILRRLLKIDIGQDFELIISAENYAEEMQDRNDITTYRIEDDHLIKVKRS
ncbi:hypothetical protein TYRP_021890 [Tyrophagus putrescentiae]|nr:hypothetical protein TYRP_021890 [Tyrophagus putrescentiae]